MSNIEKLEARLARLNEARKKANAKLRAATAREDRKTRATRTRRLILLGAAIEKAAADVDYPLDDERVRELLDLYTTRDSDRVFLGLGG
jgi:hypothetical protein